MTDCPRRAAVLVDRIDERQKGRRARRDVVVRAFAIAPAVVAAAAIRRLVVDLLERVLADVADDQRAGAAARRIVEAVAPRIAQAERPDFRPRRNRPAADERIVGRHLIAGRMRVGHVDVDAQHLAEQLLRILRAMFRIVAGAAVAEADVEIAVRSERQMPAVVIRERLRDRRSAARATKPQIESRRWVGDERI